jgi:hypothetical protein
MVTSLSELVEMIERGSIPAWLRDAILAKKEEIAMALQAGEPYTITGPSGEQIEIRAEKRAAAA